MQPDAIRRIQILSTAEMIRLLGAVTVVTGLAAAAVQSMAQLGVDLSRIETTMRLAEGVELALAKVGKAMVDARS